MADAGDEHKLKMAPGVGADGAGGAENQPSAAGLEEVKAEAPDEAAVLARLREILPTVDTQQTTEKMLRKQLQKEFSADLTHLKAAIRGEITKFLDAQVEDEMEAGGDAEEEAAEEEVVQPKKRKAGGGFGATLCDLSPALQVFLGVQQESRPQIVKKIWEYIKANNLQDPSDRRKIRPDDNLKPIFPTTVTMFSMNKVLSKHIHTAEANGSGGSKPSNKRRKDSEEDATDEDEEAEYCAPKAKKSGGGGGFTKQLQLSAELAEATGNETMSRPELTKWFTNYWKERDLLDPSDKRIVRCDTMLKSLFQVDSFKSFGEIQRLLKPHLS